MHTYIAIIVQGIIQSYPLFLSHVSLTRRCYVEPDNFISIMMSFSDTLKSTQPQIIFELLKACSLYLLDTYKLHSCLWFLINFSCFSIQISGRFWLTVNAQRPGTGSRRGYADWVGNSIGISSTPYLQVVQHNTF